MSSELSFAGVHLRLHNPTCFDESGFGIHPSLATKEICDTALQYKTVELDLPNGHGLTLLIKAVVLWRHVAGAVRLK